MIWNVKKKSSIHIRQYWLSMNSYTGILDCYLGASAYDLMNIDSIVPISEFPRHRFFVKEEWSV